MNLYDCECCSKQVPRLFSVQEFDIRRLTCKLTPVDLGKQACFECLDYGTATMTAKRINSVRPGKATRSNPIGSVVFRAIGYIPEKCKVEDK